jgi:flagellar basal-body rod protein FlgF
MVEGMLEAIRGCLKEELRMDIIANNLANATAIGFKKDRISFQSALAAAQGNQIPQAGTSAAPENNAGLVRVRTDLSQGEIRATGNPLDFAIHGSGYFKVLTPEGVRYTRKGNFALDGQGYLITQEGYRVLGKSGPILMNGNPPEADDIGKLMEMDPAGGANFQGAQVDQLDVVDLTNPETLIKEGNLLFRPSDQNQEQPISVETAIKQGYVEGSNVDVAEEMINMIHCTRDFESYQKAIQTLDKLDNKAVNEVGRLR